MDGDIFSSWGNGNGFALRSVPPRATARVQGDAGAASPDDGSDAESPVSLRVLSDRQYTDRSWQNRDASMSVLLRFDSGTVTTAVAGPLDLSHESGTGQRPGRSAPTDAGRAAGRQ